MTSTDDRDEGIDPAREGLAHLQAAAREMIAAARSMLDAVEELIDDPRAADSIAAAAGTVGRIIEGAVGTVMAHSGAAAEDEPRVQRIKVS